MKWTPVYHNNLSLKLNTNSLFKTNTHTHIDTDSIITEIYTIDMTNEYESDYESDTDTELEIYKKNPKTTFMLGTFGIIFWCIVILFIILNYSNGLTTLSNFSKTFFSCVS